MTTAVLCQGITAPQTLSTTGLPTGSQAASPQLDNTSVANAQTQAFQLIVTCSAGNCSATAQFIVSNDGVNWKAYGSAIVASSGASPNTAIGNGTQSWQFISAYITAISGTNAKAQVIMAT